MTLSNEMSDPRWVRRGLLVLLFWYLVVGFWYASFHPAPGRPHFYDERYSLENVQALIFSGTLRPASFWYPSLAYLPQTLVLGAIETVHSWTGATALEIHDGRNFTPLAYKVVRNFCVLYGAGAILLVFILGRRLFSPQVGLLAALMFATVPRFIHHVGFFKPDTLLMMMCVLVLLVTVRAAEKPSLRSYTLVGLVIGLALSTKLNGGLSALPLVATTALNSRRDRRVWLWLVIAGLVAAAVFVALNPYFVGTLLFFRRNLQLYELQATKYGGSHLNAPLRQLEYLLRVDYHGVILGTLALAGVALLTIYVLRRSTDPGQRLRLAVPLVFFYGYSIGCALVSPFTRFTLVLPMTIVTSLAGGWLGVDLLNRISGDARWRRAAVVVLLITVAALTLYPATRFVYLRVVPSTEELARIATANRLQPLRDRVVCSEIGSFALTLRKGRDRAVVHTVEALLRLEPSELDLCDAEVFYLTPDEGSAHLIEDRIAAVRAGATVLRYEPSPLRLRQRGPAIVLILHPWKQHQPPSDLAFDRDPYSPDRWRALIDPDAQTRPVLSLALWSPERTKAPSETLLWVDGSPRRLFWTRWSKKSGGAHFLSSRFVVPPGGVTVELDLPAGQELLEVFGTVQRWVPKEQTTVQALESPGTDAGEHQP